jgi:hypothetical protein
LKVSFLKKTNFLGLKARTASIEDVVVSLLPD